MLCIDSQTDNPYYNLAAEEYFLKESDEEFFILWESMPVVVVGKHQNTLSEVNYRYVNNNGIRVARRLSGGGTVFHGKGNLNFTFIRNGLPGHLVDFQLHIDPVLKFLSSLGIDCMKGTKHEILVNSRKISGNAEHVYKNRVLHHGTLLFDADLDILFKAINRTGGYYSDRAVQSNRAEVLNISDCLTPAIKYKEFRRKMYNYIRDFFSAEEYNPDEQTLNRINTLMTEKYATWDWIYGWSPDYRFSNKWANSTHELEIDFDVHRGLISTCMIRGNSSGLEVLNTYLEGKRHSLDVIDAALKQSGMDSIAGKDYSEMIYAFF